MFGVVFVMLEVLQFFDMEVNIFEGVSLFTFLCVNNNNSRLLIDYFFAEVDFLQHLF